MGMILLPALLGSVIIAIIALVKVINLWMSNSIGIKEIVLGFITSLILLGLISLVYIIEKKAWALSPAFRIPIFMVFIPFALHFVIKKEGYLELGYLSNLFLISIVFTVVLGIRFYEVIFDLLDHLGVEKYH